MGSNVTFDEDNLQGRERPKILQEIDAIKDDREKPDGKIIIDPKKRVPGFDERSQEMLQIKELVVLLPPREVPAVGDKATEQATNDEKEESTQGTQIIDQDAQQRSLRHSARARVQTKMFPGIRAFVARVGKDSKPAAITE